MNNNVYITGFSGSGKSTSGKELAQLLERDFVDMDSEIEKLQNESIPSIFTNHGEPFFRSIETGLLDSISRKTDQIVSTGGGVPTIPENVRIMRCTGKIVCLIASVETLSQRISHHLATDGEKADRPMIVSDNQTERIRDLLEIRRESYEQADVLVDTENKSPRMIANEISKVLEL